MSMEKEGSVNAPGDFEYLARDIIGKGRREKQDHPCRLFRCSRPSERDERPEALLTLAGDSKGDLLSLSLDDLGFFLRPGETRIDPAESDAIDVDVQGTPFPGERLGEPDDAGLCRRIVGLAGRAVRPRS